MFMRTRTSLVKPRLKVMRGLPLNTGDDMADLTLAQRFKRVRVFLQETQAEMARRFNVDTSTIAKWEGNKQVPQAYALDILADLEGEMESAESGNDNVTQKSDGLFTYIPVVGNIGAGATVYPIDGDTTSRAEAWIKAPRGIGAVESVRVRGDSMWPAYRDGDILFVENRDSDFPLIRNKEYILELADGRRLLKMVEPVGGDIYNLISHNAPPEPNVKILTARRVRFIRKA